MLAALVATLMLAGAPTPVDDERAATLLARGEQLLADLEYDEAASTLMRAAVARDATLKQRVRAHLLAGIANRVVGNDAEARINFRNVLLAAPDTRLPEGTSPKVASFYEAIRNEVALEQVAAVQARRDANTNGAARTDANATGNAANEAKGSVLPPPDAPSAGAWPWVLAGSGGVLAVGSAGLSGVTYVYALSKRDAVPGALDAYRLDATTQNRATLVRSVRESEAAAGQHNCLMLSTTCFLVPAGLAGIIGGVTWGVYDGTAE